MRLTCALPDVKIQSLNHCYAGDYASLSQTCGADITEEDTSMRAQVSLTPTESKKLIAKAMARMDVVKRALTEGIVVMHPSSSTIFIVEEITGKRPRTQVWVAGVVVPKGTCVALGAYKMYAQHPQTGEGGPEDYSRSWVIEKKKLSTGIILRELFERMGPKDVYIKGVNALDIEGTVGVLIGNRIEGGTIGRVVAASRRKGFSMLFPVGLEKLIPLRIEDAAKEALKKQNDYSMGISCSLMPCKGIVVTELKAIEILSGATAVPIAAGGLDGAGGAVTLVIKGEKEQVNKAIEYVEQSKGAHLPKVSTPSCDNCSFVHCDFPLKGKPWVKE